MSQSAALPRWQQYSYYRFNPIRQKLRLGVSSCLMGEPVRYDGGDKRQSMLTPWQKSVEWLLLCPEAGAGLGVPRPPVQLVEVEGELRALGVEEPGLDVTEPLQQFNRRLVPGLEKLHGYLFKARSPSCGVGTTPLFDSQRQPLTEGSGVFADALHQAYPWLPLADESLLDNDEQINRFLLACAMLADVKQALPPLLQTSARQRQQVMLAFLDYHQPLWQLLFDQGESCWLPLRQRLKQYPAQVEVRELLLPLHRLLWPSLG